VKANVVDLSGSALREIELDDRVFGIQPNTAVVHQAVVAQEANARQGTHDTRTRGEVAGGGKKPYRQKGTGYARQGSRRAPHYRGGGIIFGPHPRSYEKAMPKKMRRLALRSVLSARVAEGAVTIVDAFTLDTPKTKTLLETLTTLANSMSVTNSRGGDSSEVTGSRSSGSSGTSSMEGGSSEVTGSRSSGSSGTSSRGLPSGVIIVLAERSDGVLRAAKNLGEVHVVTPNGLNLLDLLRLPHLILAEQAVEELTRTLTADLKPAEATAE
jgi:large subunit ribosomal protein L4